jgi:hypothetical protein
LPIREELGASRCAMRISRSERRERPRELRNVWKAVRGILPKAPHDRSFQLGRHFGAALAKRQWLLFQHRSAGLHQAHALERSIACQ